MLNDLLNSLQRDGAISKVVSLRSFAGILLGPVAFVTSRASSMDWTSLTVKVNSDISGDAGALATLLDECVGGGGGWRREGVMGENGCEVDRLAISRGFSAEDLNGVRLPGSANALADVGLETLSRIVCDLDLSFNIDQNHFRFCVEVGFDGTKKRITAIPQHALDCFAQVFFNFSPRWLEGDNFSFCLCQIKYGTRHLKYGIPSL